MALLGYGCFERALKPVNPCTRSRVGDTVQVTSVDQVDLLLLVDNSNSMTEEQQSIVTEIPRIIRILSSGDRNGDGVRDPDDFTPARSLHVGIISSDMGTGPVSGIESCDPGLGDDGIMRSTSTAAGCAATYPSAIFDFTIGEDTAAFSAAVGCVASIGTGGCGFEQQLEAALKAVSLAPTGSPVTWTRPDYVPPQFLNGTFGHAGPGGLNDGFLRPNSALAIILVTDEEDCSAMNPAIFDPDDPLYATVDLNLRCHMYQSDQYPIQRYVQGFLGLRSQASLLIFGAITGVPLEALNVTPALTYQQILDLPAMQETIDPVLRNRLLPSCVAPAMRGVAYPPRRIVQVAQGLEAAGASTTIQSICNTSFSAAVDVIIEKISAALAGACLPRQLNPDGEGNVPCDVFQLLPEIGGTADYQHCADLPNADAFELEDTETVVAGGRTITRELCRVRQVGRAGAGSVPGWYYDDGTLGAASMLPTGCGQRIAFSVAQPVAGAEVRLECFQTILPGTGIPAQLGAFCNPASDPPGELTSNPGVYCDVGIATPGYPLATAGLTCDAFDRTCQVDCDSDSDCTAAGLLSYVCDPRTVEQYYLDAESAVPAALAGDLTRIHSFCVNPTCTAE